ncbi:hypothetical protein MCOR25_003444 [Pyricularia grisea]|uniref:Protein-S-isoprenylcysteine O-methyltransferase n=1 Tax=Pyricularia grisea TaxID=148305 RepID=A0A6P8AT48_PYRGI|nr:uncharacterized protein PgNI_09382 [Pyricularia grisea]KAI6373673.1 hypothetical protein MCOR25_003444 [Pyricularia grisea]TLD05283.1 hypothetical protein PgNI_09382 [Pyricularia grisea]
MEMEDSDRLRANIDVNMLLSPSPNSLSSCQPPPKKLSIMVPACVVDATALNGRGHGSKHISWADGSGMECSATCSSSAPPPQPTRRRRSRQFFAPPTPSPINFNGAGPAHTTGRKNHDPMTKTDLTLPVLSPVAQSASAENSPLHPYMPGQPKSLAGIAMRAFCLGSVLAVSVVSTTSILLLTSSPMWRLPFFAGALATHHFLEFWTTAAYNTPAANVDSYLLTANWPMQTIAYAFAALECLLVCIVFPSRAWAPMHTGPLLLLLGLVLTAVGQLIRSAAMIQAGLSFNHIVQQARGPQHHLVTTGIYAKLRHPSYFGYFYWALGSQLVLGNLVSTIAYSFVLYRFFSRRIRHEEETLVRFFGEEYNDYKRTVGTKIPFIP